MKTRIIDNWEVELTNDKGDILTLKGEWYADFFKEYENKKLIIADVAVKSEQLPCVYCGRPLKEHSKHSKICPDRMKNFKQGN